MSKHPNKHYCVAIDYDVFWTNYKEGPPTLFFIRFKWLQIQDTYNITVAWISGFLLYICKPLLILSE